MIRLPSLVYFLLALGTLIQVASADDIIWYQGTGDYYTSHKYGWQGTTDGKSAPELLLASVINQPWLVATSKTKNIIYWTDNKGVIGAWDIVSRHSSLIYQFDYGNWNEQYSGPALTGLDVDEVNNHLYFTFNQSIYRLDLSQTNPSPLLIASYGNKVFNPRFSASRNSLFFCLRNNFKEQGDLVQVSLSDPTTVTTLVYNTSTGSIVQQLFIDESANALYYNSPGTLTMRGVSLTAPYNEVFSSIYLNTNPTFFDFNPATNTFIFGSLRFDRVSIWSLGPNEPTSIYNPSYGKVTGVKFFNDTHALVAFQYQSSYPTPNEGSLILVNMNTPSDTSVLLHNFGMGLSLIFDEKYCNFHYVANVQNRTTQYKNQMILRKHINEDSVSVYKNYYATSLDAITGVALDTNKRNLIVSRSADTIGVITYAPIDKPDTPPVPVFDAQGRSISSFTISDKTQDIYYTAYEGYEYKIYRLDSKSISKDWINNVGQRIVEGIGRSQVSMAVDSVSNKLYFGNSSTGTQQIVKSNLDGSNATTIYKIDAYGIQSMRWDTSSNRLFFLTTPRSGWAMVSMNGDGSNIITTALNASTGSGRDLFSSLSPDPFSDWIYINAEYYQPLRIKKDGSSFELLYSYVPISNMRSLVFDYSSGNIYYGDAQCAIKKININKLNKADPAATNFDMVWQGDYDNFDLQSFILDSANQVFWTLQTNTSAGYPYYIHTLSVMPVSGGPAKQLYNFPKGVHYPWTINTKQSKLYAFTYTVTFNPQTPTTLVMMDLYNGSNLVTLKNFKYPEYSSVKPTAVTIDPRTGLLYYTLSSGTISLLECIDPMTLTTKKLWKSPWNALVQDIKINGTSVVMGGYNFPITIYDINTGNVRVLNASSTILALDPNSDTIYLGGGSILSMNIDDANGTATTLLSTFTIQGLAFDFAKKTAYFTLRNTSGRPLYTLPYMYQSDLDGKNKKKIQLQNGWYVPSVLGQISLVGGKFYTPSNELPNGNSLNVFNTDGSGYERIIQRTYAGRMIKYNEASQRVHWIEGTTFYGCAVYSNKYADCQAIVMFPQLQYIVPTFTSFVVADNGMVYMSSFASIYSMDLNQGQSSIKLLVNDPRLNSANSIAMNKQQSQLFVICGSSSYTQNILRVSLDGSISTLYENVAYASHLLVTDLTHCK